jgi:lipopolysaccharide transport system ATP-binding protein
MLAMSDVIVHLESVSKWFDRGVNRASTLQESFLQLFGVRQERSVDRDGFWALDDVSFQVERGQTLGLIGANGSGKSTVLKLISRILLPTRGKIAVNGRVAALLELGAGFHPDLTGRENIFLNGSILGFGKADILSRMEEMIAFADIGPFIDSPLRHYSSGMQVRLGFAVATLFNPDILLVDEVLAVGDARFQAKCLTRIQELRKQGTAILFVSHDLKAIREMCNSVVWLEQGVVRVAGFPDDAVSAYIAETWSPGSPAPSAKHKASRHLRRWGTHEAEITGVTFTDRNDAERDLFETGETMVIKLRYVAHQPLARPVFGILISRADGVIVGESKSKYDGNWPTPIDGEGSICCEIKLSLLPGQYRLTATIYDETLVHPYDHRDQEFDFWVKADQLPEHSGTVKLSAQWVSEAVEEHASRGDQPYQRRL